MCDDLELFLGDKDRFIDKTDIKVSRGFKLYEHQEVTLLDIKKAREEGNNSFLVVLPTVSGKSKIIEEDIKENLLLNPELRILIMSPTNNIKLDWFERIKLLLNEIKQNITYGDGVSNQIVITTYSSAYGFVNYLDKEYFDYIVVDEAHHAVADVTKKTIQYFNPKFLIGLTATPERLDKKRLDEVFGVYCEHLNLEEAMRKGIIAPIRAYRIESNIDLSEVRFNGKEYRFEDLERTISVESRNELIAKVLKKFFVNDKMPYKQGLIFCVSTDHANRMEKILTEYGINAKAVHTKVRNYQRYIDDYNNKKIQFLCTCQLISEGWDSPQTSIVVMARPTMSKVLYLQQLGRGLCKYEGKECLYVIDVVDQYGALNVPWSVHSIFNNPYYVPFGDILGRNISSDEMTIIEGLVWNH